MPLVPGHALFVVNPLTTRVPTGADRAATSRKRHPTSGCSIKRPACRVPHAMEPPSPYHLRSARRALPARPARVPVRPTGARGVVPHGSPRRHQRGANADARLHPIIPEGSVPVATPPTATSGLDYSHGQPFDTVLRGYERRQVDDFVAKSNDEIIRLKEDLAEAQRQRRLATEHAEATERELRELRELQGKSAHAEPIAVEDSFGYRAEKLLRMADQEAADMRAGATRDAQAVEAAARRRVEEQLRAAEAQAEDIRARAGAETASRQKQVSQEAARLDRVYRSMKGEIQRLAELLNAEAQRPDPDGGAARPDEPTSGTAANT